MKKIINLIAGLSALGMVSTQAATGWLENYIYTWSPGVGDTTYTLNGGGYPGSTTGTPVGAFNGANLGTFNVNDNYSLYMNAAISAWADGGDAYSNLSLVYRAFQGSPSGSFNTVSATSAQIFNIGGNDFRGFATGANLSGLSEGTWTIQAYLSRSHTWNSGAGGPFTTYLTTTGDTGGTVPTGNYFTASVNIIPEPSSSLLMGLGLAGLAVLRRARKTA